MPTVVPCAEEMRLAGFEAALANIVLQMNRNCAQGSLTVDKGQPAYDSYVTGRLIAAGYKVVATKKAFVISW